MTTDAELDAMDAGLENQATPGLHVPDFNTGIGKPPTAAELLVRPAENWHWTGYTWRAPAAPAEPLVLPTAGGTVHKALSKMEARANKTEKPIPLPWASMGNALSDGGEGFWPGLHVLVSNSGVGKTQFALQIGLHAAQHSVPVAYCGLEMTAYEINTRLLGLLTTERWSKLFHGTANEALRAAAITAARRLDGLPFYIDEGTPYGWSYDRMRMVADAVRAKHPDGPMVLIVDFLQVVGPKVHPVTGEPDKMEQRECIARASYQARHIAKTMDAAVVLVSSTSRANYAALDEEAAGVGDGFNSKDETMENRPKKQGKAAPARKPFGEGDAGRFVGLGKESGEIEFSADTVMVLGRNPKGGGEDSKSVLLGLAKVRAGRTAWLPFMFDGNRFEEGNGHVAAAAARAAQDGGAGAAPSGYAKVRATGSIPVKRTPRGGPDA